MQTSDFKNRPLIFYQEQSPLPFFGPKEVEDDKSVGKKRCSIPGEADATRRFQGESRVASSKRKSASGWRQRRLPRGRGGGRETVKVAHEIFREGRTYIICDRSAWLASGRRWMCRINAPVACYRDNLYVTMCNVSNINGHYRKFRGINMRLPNCFKKYVYPVFVFNFKSPTLFSDAASWWEITAALMDWDCFSEAARTLFRQITRFRLKFVFLHTNRLAKNYLMIEFIKTICIFHCKH